jgi:hypothetical protein
MNCPAGISTISDAKEVTGQKVRKIKIIMPKYFMTIL